MLTTRNGPTVICEIGQALQRAQARGEEDLLQALCISLAELAHDEGQELPAVLKEAGRCYVQEGRDRQAQEGRDRQAGAAPPGATADPRGTPSPARGLSLLLDDLLGDHVDFGEFHVTLAQALGHKDVPGWRRLVEEVAELRADAAGEAAVPGRTDACPACGTTMIESVGERSLPIHGQEIVVKDVPHRRCPACSQVVLTFEQAGQLRERAERQAREARGGAPPPLRACPACRLPVEFALDRPQGEQGYQGTGALGETLQLRPYALGARWSGTCNFCGWDGHVENNTKAVEALQERRAEGTVLAAGSIAVEFVPGPAPLPPGYVKVEGTAEPPPPLTAPRTVAPAERRAAPCEALERAWQHADELVDSLGTAAPSVPTGTDLADLIEDAKSLRTRLKPLVEQQLMLQDQAAEHARPGGGTDAK